MDKKIYKNQSKKISFIYFILGSIWVVLSSKIVMLLSINNETLTLLDTYKEWFYITATSFMLYYLLEKSLNKIQAAEIKMIQKNQDLIAAHEEIEATNEEIHQQYEELKSYMNQLEINQDRLKRAQTLAHVGNWELDLENKKMWASSEAFRIYGIRQESAYLPLSKVQAMANQADRPLLDSALHQLIHKQMKYDLVFRINREEDATERVLHTVAILERNPDGKPQKVLGVVRDITEQHLAEKQMRYFAEHDAVTGIYNRRFFEQEISNFTDTIKTIGVLMCDIDGLKLINDTMGYEEGDKYLIACATILTEACGKESMIARIGGDEFVILLKNKGQEGITQIYHTINKEVEAYNRQRQSIPLSVSVGLAYCDACSQTTISQAIKEAEEKMYFDKLLHAQSMRSRTVDLLMKTLEARDYITEGHTDRLQKIVEKIAAKIGMSEQEKSKLSLFARFHDIGKIGIRDAILFKPGKLDTEEFEEMKKHSEYGYRIANSAPDLAHISDLILKHHEWWNGQGYPLGLTGQEIPLECRILAIADAYDSMRNDRPYRKAMSHHESVQELEKFTGIQFDPDLVKVFLDGIEE